MTPEEIAKKISIQIETLNKTKIAHCWICGKSVSNWGVLLPKIERDDLGFGSPTDEEKMRIAFFPFCKEHDINENDIQSQIQHTLSIKRQEFLN